MLDVTRSQVDVETVELMLKQIQSHTSIHWWGSNWKDYSSVWVVG